MNGVHVIEHSSLHFSWWQQAKACIYEMQDRRHGWTWLRCKSHRLVANRKALLYARRNTHNLCERIEVERTESTESCMRHESLRESSGKQYVFDPGPRTSVTGSFFFLLLYIRPPVCDRSQPVRAVHVMRLRAGRKSGCQCVWVSESCNKCRVAQPWEHRVRLFAPRHRTRVICLP